eukprot:CCRYP_014199-RE/>CCRYP_014199-RE protein AED:0.47 eAED:1.00 QI:0/-1/0/1/-1/0/1/0/42
MGNSQVGNARNTSRQSIFLSQTRWLTGTSLSNIRPRKPCGPT